MRTIKPESLDQNRVKWTGYNNGAIKLSAATNVETNKKGNTIVTIEDGRKFDCHNLSMRCSCPDKQEGNRIIFSKDFYEMPEGVYPIRFEIT